MPGSMKGLIVSTMAGVVVDVIKDMDSEGFNCREGRWWWFCKEA